MTNDEQIAPGVEVRVRPADLASAADAQAVVTLLDGYARDPMGDGIGLAPAVKERLPGVLRSFPGAVVLLAWSAARPVGVAVCFTGFSTFRAAPVLNIHDLAVIPAYRGRGIGARLLAAVENEARARGCCKVTLEVREDNPARALYERLGYGAGSNGGMPVQYYFLEKRL